MNTEGFKQNEDSGWMKWVRGWTAEENRHGDVLNKFLYLSGRVNMREIEITTQHLIADGFDIGTDRDPYKNFVYTTFQELATNISHKRVGQMAKKRGGAAVEASGADLPGDTATSFVPVEPKDVPHAATPSIIEQILDLARWAPSGDNTQPWRFQIVDQNHVVIHGFDTREHCVYDLDGHPSQISLGALLETISLAATAHGLKAHVLRRLEAPETTPTFDVQLEPDENITPDSLIPYIRYRSVQRRPMSTRQLTVREKSALEASVGEPYRILWLEGFAQRYRAARLMFSSAKLRLTMPEAYEVHRAIIQWNARFSEDRVPDQALGVDRVTARLMRWIMQSWQRVNFFNTFLAGTWAPRIQMDLIPGVACAATVPPCSAASGWRFC